MATPLAVVLTELMQNAVEHGYPPNEDGSPREGLVTVKISREGDHAVIDVRDDGVGLPPDFSPESSTGLGLSIVRTLVTSELAGSITMKSDGGTWVRWSMEGSNGFLGKAISLVMDMDAMVGGDFEQGLADLDAGAEQLEFEDGPQRAEIGRRERPDAQSALPHAREGAVVLTEFVLELGQPGEAQGVVPVGVDLLEVVAHVEHREAVDLHRRLRFWCLGCRSHGGGQQHGCVGNTMNGAGSAHGGGSSPLRRAGAFFFLKAFLTFFRLSA